jgi:hypothetical protein
MMRGTVATSETLEGLDVQCTHCGIRMTSHWGSENRIRYFRCSSCHRWVSSTYAEVLKGDANVRPTSAAANAERAERFTQVKNRLERWLSALDDKDPYNVLGVSPFDGSEKIKNRYRELALESHPDRGGSPDRMRELNLAYERIVLHQERRGLGPMTERPRASAGLSLPARRR